MRVGQDKTSLWLSVQGYEEFILFADKIVLASYKLWKGNSEMHHLWKKRQGITRRHRKTCPANKGVCHTLPCLSPFIPQSKPFSHGHL